MEESAGLIHSGGATLWIAHLARRFSDHDGPWRAWSTTWTFMSTGIVLLTMHTLEAFAWAVAFFLVPETPQLKSFEEALYFSIVTFTTLGYGDITLGAPWRLLSGAEALNGILLAGWSTALLFTVVQRSRKLKHTPSGHRG